MDCLLREEPLRPQPTITVARRLNLRQKCPMDIFNARSVLCTHVYVFAGSLAHRLHDALFVLDAYPYTNFARKVKPELRGCTLNALASALNTFPNCHNIYL